MLAVRRTLQRACAPVLTSHHTLALRKWGLVDASSSCSFCWLQRSDYRSRNISSSSSSSASDKKKPSTAKGTKATATATSKSPRQRVTAVPAKKKQTVKTAPLGKTSKPVSPRVAKQKTKSSKQQQPVQKKKQQQQPQKKRPQPYTYPDPTDVLIGKELEEKILSLPLRRFKSLFLNHVDPPHTPLEVVVPAVRAGTNSSEEEEEEEAHPSSSSSNPASKTKKGRIQNVFGGGGGAAEEVLKNFLNNTLGGGGGKTLVIQISIPQRGGGQRGKTQNDDEDEDDDDDDDDDDDTPGSGKKQGKDRQLNLSKLAKQMEGNLTPDERKELRAAVAAVSEDSPESNEKDGEGKTKKGAKRSQAKEDEGEEDEAEDDEDDDEDEDEDDEETEKRIRRLLTHQEQVIDKLPPKLRQFHQDYITYTAQREMVEQETFDNPTVHCACCGSFVCSMESAFSHSYGWPMFAEVNSFTTNLEQSWKCNDVAASADGTGNNNKMEDMNKLVRASISSSDSNSAGLKSIEALVEEKRKQQQFKHLPLDLTRAIIANQQQQSPTSAARLHCDNCTGFLGVAVLNEGLVHKQGVKSTNQRYVLNANSIFVAMGSWD